MAFRPSIRAKDVPFTVKWALDGCNNKLVYGGPGTTPASLLSAACDWEEAARKVREAGQLALANVYQRHADRYLHAAQVVEQYNGTKRRS